MGVLKTVLSVVAAGAVALIAIIAMRPDDMHIERSKVINAAPADLFPYANDFDLWLKWNPWKDLDANQEYTFSDNRVGVGAWYTWKGEKAGSGKMSITEIEENKTVRSSLEFIEPFQSTAAVTMAFAPEGEGTRVTWSFDEKQGFMSKAAGLFMDMDTMLGGDFEKGLNTLTPLAEASAAQRKEAEAAEAAAAAAAAAVVDPNAPAATTTPQ